MFVRFSALLLVLVVGVAPHLACSQSVIVRTDAPAHVVLDGQDLGTVDDSGVVAEVSLGVLPVAYSVERDGVRVEGELPRTRPSWLPNTAGLCGPFVTAPLCVCMGLSCANPQFFASPVFCLLASLGNINLLFGSCYGLCAQVALTPGWMTVPLGCAGLTLGMSPLLLLGFAGLDDTIVLEGPDATRALPGSTTTPSIAPTTEPEAPATQASPDVAPDEEMRW